MKYLFVTALFLVLLTPKADASEKADLIAQLNSLKLQLIVLQAQVNAPIPQVAGIAVDNTAVITIAGNTVQTISAPSVVSAYLACDDVKSMSTDVACEYQGMTF